MPASFLKLSVLLQFSNTGSIQEKAVPASHIQPASVSGSVVWRNTFFPLSLFLSDSLPAEYLSEAVPELFSQCPGAGYLVINKSI
jgi:hypothetical protein